MPSDLLPMFRVVRKRGRIEEIVIGPSAGKIAVRIVLIASAVALLATGIVKWEDVASMAARMMLPW